MIDSEAGGDGSTGDAGYLKTPTGLALMGMPASPDVQNRVTYGNKSNWGRKKPPFPIYVDSSGRRAGDCGLPRRSRPGKAMDVAIISTSPSD